MDTFIHTSLRTWIHTFTLTKANGYMHAYVPTYILTCTQGYIHIHSNRHTWIHTYIHAYIHTLLRTYRKNGSNLESPDLIFMWACLLWLFRRWFWRVVGRTAPSACGTSWQGVESAMFTVTEATSPHWSAPPLVSSAQDWMTSSVFGTAALGSSSTLYSRYSCGSEIHQSPVSILPWPDRIS